MREFEDFDAKVPLYRDEYDDLAARALELGMVSNAGPRSGDGSPRQLVLAMLSVLCEERGPAARKAMIRLLTF